MFDFLDKLSLKIIILPVVIVFALIIGFCVWGNHTKKEEPKATTVVKEETTTVVETEEETTKEVKKKKKKTDKLYKMSVEELAEKVVQGKYGNGEERIKKLGDRYDEVQAYIDENYAPEPETYIEYSAPEQAAPKQANNDTSGEYAPQDLRFLGVIYWGGWRFTWYSENVLPGGGLSIPGRWSDGNFVRDENGNICVASSDLPYGSSVATPWGNGVVYDSGCASGTIDIYTSW